jgi:hypothetical protein
LEKEITPLLESRERALGEDQAGQMGLFPEEEKKLGYVKPDRAAFERFMRSPFVNKLRKALRADQDIIDRAKQLPELRAKIAELQAKADEMEKTRLEYSDAARTIKLLRDVDKQRVDINQLRDHMTDFVVERMELQGRLGELKTLRNELLNQGRALGETVEPPFMRELNSVEDSLHKLAVEAAEIDGGLKTLESAVKVEAAKITLAKLNPKMVSKEALATAKQNLLDAQRAAGVISSEAGKVITKQREEAARAKRTADAIAAAKSVQERIDLGKANQERLEAMYGESARGIEVPAISEAQRAAREMGEPVLSEEEQADIAKNPLKVLGGYRSSITSIEKRLAQAQKTSNEARMQDLKELLETRDKLDKQYKDAQSADERSKILPELEAAENAYDDAASKLATEPLTWKGMAKDIRELSEYYVKADLLEDKINTGKVRLPEETPPKVIVKPSRAQKKAVAEKLASEQNAEAAKRANAPTTSGEKLTRSETQKARESEKTVYSGKGIGQEGLTKQDEARLEMLRKKQASGQALNPFEQNFIQAKAKVQPSGINFKPEKVKSANPAQDLIDLIQKNTKPDPKDPAVRIQDGVGLDLKRAGPNTVHMALIKNYGERGVGKASKRLNEVLKAADDLGVNLSVTVEAVKDKRSGLSSGQLEQWYAKNGFKPSDIGMTRKPINEPKKFQTTQEGEAVPLSEEANTELKRGSVAGALNDVADNSKDALKRAVAQRLKMLLGETKVTIDDNLKTDEGIAAHGAASKNGRHIWLNGKTGLNEETLLHESVHAATERIIQMPEDKLTKEQLAAKRELQALHEAIQNDPDITSADAKGSLSEFVAEALSNKELQDQLRNKKWTLRNAWDSFKKMLMDMLGIKVPENMLDATLASADTLFARPEKLIEPKAEAKDVFRVAKYDSKLDEAGKLAERLIATQRPLSERMNANAFGRGEMEFMVKIVDQYAPLEKISKQMDSLNGTQMMHYLRMVGQRMNLLGQTVGVGAPELKKIIRADGRAEWVYEAKEGPSLVGVAKALQPANQLAGSPEAANNLFSLYSIAKRAESVGLDKLNYKNVTQAQLDKALAQIKAVPGLEATFKNAHAEYEKFNRNTVQFGVDTGVFSKEMAQKMTQNGDYVPYYRENGDGSVSLMMGQERIQNMGNVKDQPYLHELVGGDQRIADFMTSSVNNANMILEMGLRNQAGKSVAFELEKIGMAKIGNGAVRSGPDVLKFKLDGKDKFAVVEGTPDDIPPELLVKGMEGIPVQTSALLKLAGIPSRILREAFVANPISAGRILFKDTISSAMTSGSNFDGMRAAMRNVGDNLMERRGISGGEVYTGLPQDLTKILRQVQSGKPGWESLLAKANVLHAKADAMTRQIRYESYLKQGLSEMEANHMALESMNFTRRGISPSIHVMNTLHPFLNSQIQGLNTLIKAIRGNMPMNEKLRIREKIIKRGMLLGGATMLYSALMQDDETYKNALPEQKYNNFFVPFPGLDEKVRVPIPFEAGILFKSVPEALMNYMYGNDKDAAAGMRQAVMKLIPGAESYGVPQILAPGIETAMGKSFYTGRDIESRHEQSLVPGMRTREGTSGIAAELGEMLNISPVKIDHLIGGYTGQLGLAVTQMASSMVFGPKMAGPEVAKHWSQEPLIGSTFQPKDAGAVVEDAYQMMTEANQVKATYQDLLKKGKVVEAQAYLNKNAEEYAKSGVSAKFTAGMTQFMNAINATKQRTDLTPEQKMQEIDKIKAQRLAFAEQMKAAASSVGKTTPQPALQ